MPCRSTGSGPTVADLDPAGHPKRTRTRLAKAETWMLLATTAQNWADGVASKPGTRTIPFDQWPADDPMVQLARRYGLTPTELSKAVASIADQLETRAMAAGYDEAFEADHG